MKTKKYIKLNSCLLSLAAVFCLTITGFSQNPAPAKPQAKPIVLTGATIHLGNGQIIENGVIAFDKGIITQVGTSGSASTDTNAEVIDVKGKHIFPGLISMNTTVGIQEIASVRATLDYSEVGEINPHVRALVAYNTDSEVIPTLRNTGILLSQAVPQGGIISGSSSVFYTDGWNWEDAVLKKDDGIWMSWPAYLSTNFNYEDFSVALKKNEKRQETIDKFRTTFAEAKGYATISKPASTNIRLEAMKNIFNGTVNLYIRADYAKDMIEAVKFAQEFGIKKIVIVGGDQSNKITGFLKENNVSVVLNQTHRLPNATDEDVYLPYELPGILTKAGVKVAVSYADEWWRTRNLAFLAGTASGFSDIKPEEALQLITKNAAEIMGIDKYVGTLEKGKQASLIVTGGDLLDMRGNEVSMVFIKGGKVNLDNKQKRLYDKYKEKYGQK